MEIRKKDLINLVNDTLSDTLSDTLNDTLNLLKIIPNIRQREIAMKLQVSDVTIKRNIKKLKEKGYIKREGTKKEDIGKY